VFDRGADRGPLNQLVATLTPFQDDLYLGTAIQGGGYDRVNGVGPAAGEVLRDGTDRARAIENDRAGACRTLVESQHKLDAVLFPGWSGAAIAAKAGYPSVQVPAAHPYCPGQSYGGFDVPGLQPAQFSVVHCG